MTNTLAYVLSAKLVMKDFSNKFNLVVYYLKNLNLLLKKICLALNVKANKLVRLFLVSFFQHFMMTASVAVFYLLKRLACNKHSSLMPVTNLKMYYDI